MANKATAAKPRRNFPHPSIDDHPLLRVLIAEAARRGDTLTLLARHLGVSYVRLAQWRRKESDIANASRPVVEAAGAYLGIPTAYVLCMTGVIGLNDFVFPGKESLSDSVNLELRRMRDDPYFAGFAPDALLVADPEIQQFVAFLYRELSGTVGRVRRPDDWFRSMHLAALGDAKAAAELASLKIEKAQR